jgi:hypothetical protein
MNCCILLSDEVVAFNRHLDCSVGFYSAVGSFIIILYDSVQGFISNLPLFI